MSAGERLLPVRIRGLIQDPSSRTPIVILTELGGERIVPIWIGPFEAQAIALALEEIEPPRPMTHDLLAAVVARLGASVRRVVIRSLEERTFFATLELAAGDEVLALDARPSDALALCLRFGASVLVHESVFAALERQPEETDGAIQEEDDDDERLRRLLEALAPEDLGEYRM